MGSPVQSYSLDQYVVNVLSVSDLNGIPVAQVQDGFGRTYPPIPVTNVWGSGVLPVPGEWWVVVKDNGSWTFKMRLSPITSLVVGNVDVTVGAQPAAGQQLVSIMGPVSVTTSATGTFSATFPHAFAFTSGYALSMVCTSGAYVVTPDYSSCSLSILAGTLYGASGATVDNTAAVVMVTALGA